MGFLLELLMECLPGRVDTRRAYVRTGAVWTAIVLLACALFGRGLTRSWTEGLPWAGAAGGCVLLGFALAYPFVRGRLTERP
ncbi:hypothetical protein GCM10009801_68250 [Streptomyces albiaxialis]|uniref:Uncharacterized protein n=1 Tax=Streptomyces albiaxialis TaxID=329523 RepID=A0ABN2WRZ5_9ACTN